jgi:thymidine kinase
MSVEGCQSACARQQLNAREGCIHVTTGPMFAGKSTALLQNVREHVLAGKKVTLLKPLIDQRYSSGDVVTHAGDKEPCYAVALLNDFKRSHPIEYEETDVIAIDEAQFFLDLVEFSVAAADDDHKMVFVAGLDGDFKRGVFGKVLELVPYADSIKKLQSRCAFCNKPGLFSLRIIADARQELVGAGDMYQPVCRTHFNRPPKRKMLGDITNQAELAQAGGAHKVLKTATKCPARHGMHTTAPLTPAVAAAQP